MISKGIHFRFGELRLKESASVAMVGLSLIHILVRFLNEADRQGKLMKGAALLSVLTKKDLRDVPYDCLLYTSRHGFAKGETSLSPTHFCTWQDGCL